MVLSADECRALQRVAEGVEKQAADTLAERAESAIRRATSQGASHVTLQIPIGLYGLPAFDRRDVQARLSAIFIDAGYAVTAADAPYSIDVSWAVPPALVTISDAGEVDVAVYRPPPQAAAASLPGRAASGDVGARVVKLGS